MSAADAGLFRGGQGGGEGQGQEGECTSSHLESVTFQHRSSGITEDTPWPRGKVWTETGRMQGEPRAQCRAQLRQTWLAADTGSGETPAAWRRRQGRTF